MIVVYDLTERRLVISKTKYSDVMIHQSFLILEKGQVMIAILINYLTVYLLHIPALFFRLRSP